MFLTRVYYDLKPFLPLGMRHVLRRLSVRRRLSLNRAVWPVLESAGAKPADWPGWPGGKRFAFVLTHDVEGQIGLDKCRQLMELEQRLGFRSSFNFIPEGEYRVSPELRTDLRRNGFEVAVHDLHHDGKLYRTREQFRENAARINHYLKDWGAVGFRSGFMLHQLDWLHDLNVLYDASTFDTDPFEPQPEGNNTIFPFWISNGKGAGYVELPYSLPQDSTLFLLLREKDPKIWLDKLDWVAQRGGMALIDTHPDYFRFNGERPSFRTYPADFYEQLLKHARQRYGDSFWHPLPSELAAWYKETVVQKPGKTVATSVQLPQTEQSPPATTKKSPALAGKRAVVVLYSYFLSDPRPRRETESLVRAGMEVDVICLRRDSETALTETVNGVRIFRVPMKRRRENKLTYAIQYSTFLLACFLFVSFRSLTRRCHLVHVHNMPDFLVFSSLLPRLFGARVILDLHDPMPELFQGIYALPESARLVRVLKTLEKWSIGFAHKVVTPNLAFKELFAGRSCRPEKIEVVMNSPEPGIFKPVPQPAEGAARKETFCLMYHGLLVDRHGLHLAVQAIAKIHQRIPNIKLWLYGERTAYMDGVMGLVKDLKLEGVVEYYGYKPLKEIAEAISRMDMGIIPNRLNPFTQVNMPTRIFEYMAVRKPVIVPRTRGISDYFADDEIIYFEPENVDDLASKIEWAYFNPAKVEEVLEKGLRVYAENRWEVQERRLIHTVESLLTRPKR